MKTTARWSAVGKNTNLLMKQYPDFDSYRARHVIKVSNNVRFTCSNKVSFRRLILLGKTKIKLPNVDRNVKRK